MSVYLPNQKALFLHIPRTGGGWTMRAINTLGLPAKLPVDKPEIPHRYEYMHRLLPQYLLDQQNNQREEREFKFIWTQVRHPIPYYESMWKWLTKQSGHRREMSCYKFMWSAFQRPAQLYVSDFNAWVERMLDDQGAWVTRLFWTFIGPPGAEYCHFIGRTSTLLADLTMIMELFDHKQRLINKLLVLSSMEKPNRTDDERKKIVWRKDILSQALDVERVAINRWFKGEERNKRCYREYQWGFRKLNKEKHRIDYQGV